MSDKPKIDPKAKELAKILREKGNTYGSYRMFLFTEGQLEQFADAIDPPDPPRFTEAQMAFLRGVYGMGAVKMKRNGEWTYSIMPNGEYMKIELLSDGETLDLAEMFGKEEAK